jgi:hypothetical protein
MFDQPRQQNMQMGSVNQTMPNQPPPMPSRPFPTTKVTSPDNVPVSYMAKGGDVKKQDAADKAKSLREAEKKHSNTVRKDANKVADRTKVKTDYSTPPPKPEHSHNSAINQSKTSDATKEAIKHPEDQITPVKTENVDTDKNQFIKNDGNVVDNPRTVSSVSTGKTSTAARPEETDAHLVDETTKTQEGVQGVTDNLQAAHGTVSDQAQAEAATALPSSDATVQGQLAKLYQSFEGGATPPWAAGAMRMANTAMMSRGLGSSSMAGAAITQAAMESAIGIAAQDAATFSQFEMQNLNNRQQARLQNAQAFLQMDLQNANADQQTAIFKAQANIQSLFTDAAAENATKQFNATSQNQTDQFFANLKSQVDTFNAAQKNSMQQFNAGQKNAVKMFNVSQLNDVKKFNAANRLIIDQSNVKWRQQIATINNANDNEANRINAQAATGLTMAGYNNLWQTERDLMAYAFTAAENMSQRAHEIVLTKMGVKNAKDLQDSENQNELWKAAGSLAANIFDDWDFF